MNKKIVQKVVFDKKDQENRLDLFAATKFNISRSQTQKLLKEELILVNNLPAKTKQILKVGDTVTKVADEVKKHPEIEIIFEDKDIFVINKPSGVSAHPSPGDKDPVITEIFKDRLSHLKGDRPGIVHRLDKGTSGVMVMAKEEESLEIIQKQFKNRNIQKEYVALIKGGIKPQSGIIDIPIERNPAQREKMSISKNGKEAVTEYETLDTYKGYTLLRLSPKTGRTHQLRVHLAALGYPIVGDRKYGTSKDDINRIFLHARKLTFRHPKTEKLQNFIAPLPKELEDFLRNLPR